MFYRKITLHGKIGLVFNPKLDCIRLLEFVIKYVYKLISLHITLSNYD
jgi:hypothetical protein